MTSPLTDLDELILRCRDERAKAYLYEAVVSYRAGAFRSAIVATWIAICFDFIDKLQELSLAGDKEAETQVAELEKIRATGDVARALKFERELLVVVRDKFELISPLEFIDLERLQEDRNRCAHPSLVSEGQAYNPSGELARLHISAAVTNVLQHPPAQGKYALERLIKDVSSDYFPIKKEEAKASLSSGPLRKPRDSLVRNFVVVLLKTFLLETKDYKFRRRIAAALTATSELHPAPYRTAISEKLSHLLRQIDDSSLYTAFAFFHQVPDSWQFVQIDVAQKFSNYVLNMPSDDFDYIDSALAIPELRSGAEARIKRATRKELEEIIFFDLPKQVGDRFIELYFDSRSFDQANRWAKQMIIHSSDFSAEQVRDILQSISSNPQVSGSFEVAGLVSALRKRKKIPAGDFEKLLRDHGLENFAESEVEQT